MAALLNQAPSSGPVRSQERDIGHRAANLHGQCSGFALGSGTSQSCSSPPTSQSLESGWQVGLRKRPDTLRRLPRLSYVNPHITAKVSSPCRSPPPPPRRFPLHLQAAALIRRHGGCSRRALSSQTPTMPPRSLLRRQAPSRPSAAHVRPALLLMGSHAAHTMQYVAHSSTRQSLGKWDHRCRTVTNDYFLLQAAM